MTPPAPFTGARSRIARKPALPGTCPVQICSGRGRLIKMRTLLILDENVSAGSTTTSLRDLFARDSAPP
jgi:hypothetical protein